jgi:hypothetical protein
MGQENRNVIPRVVYGSYARDIGNSKSTNCNFCSNKKEFIKNKNREALLARFVQCWATPYFPLRVYMRPFGLLFFQLAPLLRVVVVPTAGCACSDNTVVADENSNPGQRLHALAVTRRFRNSPSNLPVSRSEES